MKRRFYLLMVMVLLLGLLPATALAAAPGAAAPKPPYVTVRDWSLPMDPKLLPIGVFLYAEGINWRAPKAATVELGYLYCVGGRCSIAVEATHTITKDDKYPQNLLLKSWEGHWLVAGNCTLQQFVSVRDRSGEVVAEAWSPEDHVCMEY